MGCYLAMQKPANDHSFESGVLEQGNIEMSVYLFTYEVFVLKKGRKSQDLTYEQHHLQVEPPPPLPPKYIWWNCFHIPLVICWSIKCHLLNANGFIKCWHINQVPLHNLNMHIQFKTKRKNMSEILNRNDLLYGDGPSDRKMRSQPKLI